MQIKHLVLLLLLKPVRRLCCTCCKLFWTWPCTTFNSIPNILNLLTNRNIALIYSVIICEQQTIVHGQGASTIKHSTVVFKLDVCRLS